MYIQSSEHFYYAVLIENDGLLIRLETQWSIRRRTHDLRLHIRLLVELDEGDQQGKDQRADEHSNEAENLQSAEHTDQDQNRVDLCAAAHQTWPKEIVDIHHDRRPENQKADTARGVSIKDQ